MQAVLRRAARGLARRQRLLAGLAVGSGTVVAARRGALLQQPDAEPLELQGSDWDFVHRLSQRSRLLVDTGSRWVDVDAVRKWHVGNNYLGGIVLRQLAMDEKLYVDPGWTGTPEKARRECYFLYYEISGTGKREQHLFIRGSHLVDDVLTDLRIGKTWDEECGCYIHTGFLRKASLLLEDVMPLLDRHHDLVLVGHSLGGAMAVIVGMKLAKRGFNVCQVVTFGAPKVITESGCETWRGKLEVTRVVHHSDPIPTLPMLCLDPHVALDRYAHFGKLVLILPGPGQGPYIALKGRGSESRLVDSFWLTATLLHLGTHRMRRYEEELGSRARNGATSLPYSMRWSHPHAQAGAWPVIQEKG